MNEWYRNANGTATRWEGPDHKGDYWKHTQTTLEDAGGIKYIEKIRNPFESYEKLKPNENSFAVHGRHLAKIDKPERKPSSDLRCKLDKQLGIERTITPK